MRAPLCRDAGNIAPDDIIRGGTGDDWTEDDFTPGIDQDNFAPGDDLDIIYDSGGTDSLRFDQGINPTDRWFMRDETRTIW